MAETRIPIFATSLLCWVVVCSAELYSGGQCIDPRKRAGICMPFKDCPIVQEELTWIITPSLCETTNRHPVVCCPYQPMVTPPTPVTPSPWSKPPLPSIEFANRPHVFSEPIMAPEAAVTASPPVTNPPRITSSPPLAAPPLSEVVNRPQISPQSIIATEPAVTVSSSVSTPPRITSLPPLPEVANRPQVAPELLIAPEPADSSSNPSTIPSTVIIEPPLTTLPSESSPSRKPGEIAENYCYRYSQACGSSLVGGTKVQPKEFPHMAALGFGPLPNISWSCGGSLISEKFVLTAAHCLSSSQTGKVSWVLLASEVTRSYDEGVPEGARKGQTHPVIRRIRHPQYKPPAKYHDIALLEIGPALESYALPLDTRELHPACLPLDFLDADPIYVATGWGRVGFGEDPSPDLLKVELNLLDAAICNQTFDLEIRTTNKLRRGIDETMICAGVLEGGKDTCKGDSGGPLQVPFRDACMYEVWGITSFGKICGLENSPAVYTRVSEYIPWIESIVWT